MTEHTNNDKQHMLRALELARLGWGRTSPNPLVGAVLVKDGKVVGEGYHRKAGDHHAEVAALLDAGDAAEGSTCYVNLEPCSHHGRTPPCTDALIRAGVKEVVYAIGDPNPQVNGRGRRLLEAAGIRVRNHLCRAEASKLNLPYFHHIQTGLPYVTAKFAMSLDGKIATRTGDAKWISNEQSRRQGHVLRNESDVILVGVGTVLADNPRLTTRLEQTAPTRHPIRIVADSSGRTPLDATLFSAEMPGQTILATTALADTAYIKAVENQGVMVWQLPKNSEGKVDLRALMEEIGRNGWVNVMVEGGGTLLEGLLREKLIHQVWAFIAPIIIGGAEAPTPFNGRGVEKLADALQLENLQTTNLGGDIWIQAQVKK